MREWECKHGKDTRDCAACAAEDAAFLEEMAVCRCQSGPGGEDIDVNPACPLHGTDGTHWKGGATNDEPAPY